MKTWLNKYKYPLLVAAIFVVHAIITFWGVLRYHYPVAPGDDSAVHLQIIASLQAHPVLWPTGSYPPGYHYIIIALSHLTGQPPYAVMATVWPAFIILAGLAVFWLAWQCFGIETAIVAYALFALICPQPLQTAYDGGFPDIIATGILLPIALVFWVKLWRRFQFWPLIGFVVASAAVIFTHHLSTLALLGIVTISAVILSIIRAIKVGGRRGWAIVLACAAAIGALILVFEKTSVFASARSLLDSGVSGAQSPVWNAIIYGQSLTGLIFQMGFIGAALVIWWSIKNRFAARTAGPIILTVWFTLYFVGSELPFIVQPDRLSRDLAIPASILAAAAIIWLARRFQVRPFFQTAFIVALVLLAIPAFIVKTNSQLVYNKMIRFSQADETALHYIDTHGPYPYLVWAQNDFWQFTAAPEIANGKIQLVQPPQLTTVYQGKSCALIGYYRSNVWLPFTQDLPTINQYLHDPRLSNKLLAQDPNKVWYLVCKK